MGCRVVGNLFNPLQPAQPASTESNLLNLLNPINLTNLYRRFHFVLHFATKNRSGFSEVFLIPWLSLGAV